ncbi:protein kinase domain-containing protein [Tautonia marina]|uniref:serine/threonine-protein kinase n=1 Tax=Tautonia marina TaxID=2653855 RepID=UPI00126064FB|nr:serine/threonine-protein kinase [Tautonia marina]
MAMMPTPGRPPRPLDSNSDLLSSEARRELDRLRVWAAPSASNAVSGAVSTVSHALETLLEDFTRRWEQGEHPRAEQFFDRLPPGDPETRLELIYHEFCLQASSGHQPSVEDFVGRFPEYRDRLLRLIALHDVLPTISFGQGQATSPLKPGDEVGPYRLLREMGRGGFAHVYLAADAELEDRLLVLKVTDRPSAEHRYLARAPHPHIVPILRERITDDGLQLIFMPFVGGATLGEVLQESRRRSRRPERGLDLLADLDLCSAPEYTAATPVRPARELLASLSYAGAVAWVIARLAEALDHAYQRGVIHGDLKPSNILIGGDGQPMLFDFNLSTDWQPAAHSRSSGEMGGTLAYMAPERLRALASPETASPPCPSACHQADVYALGLILREALTGVPPSVPLPDESPRSGRALAALLAADRAAGDPSARRQLVSIPPGLRAILRRCLEPDPTRRYRLASQLAADLDCWRSGLPLLHTTPPLWVELSRWLHYHQRPFLAAACCICLGLIASVAAAKVQEDQTESKRQLTTTQNALNEAERQAYFRFVSDPESSAHSIYTYRSSGMTPPEGRIDFAERLLDAYGLMGASNDHDFWNSEPILRLDEPHRSDARALILEQALRYGIELSRSRYAPFPDDRRRAVEVLDRILRHHSLEPLETTARLLRSQLGLPTNPPRPSPTSVPPRWLLSYLQGVRAEALRPDEASAMGISTDQIGFAVAITHYSNALLDRDDLYWPRVRLAASAYQIGNFATARHSYQRCLDLHPESALLWLGLGSSEYHLGSEDESVTHSRQAVEIEPRWQTGWQALATLGARLKRWDLVEESVQQVRLGSVRGAREPWRRLRLDLSVITDGAVANTTGIDPDTLPVILAREADDDLTEIGLRASVARSLLNEGRTQDAIDQFSRILAVEPAHVYSRFCRAIGLQRAWRSAEAIEDYRIAVDDPNFDSFLQQQPTALIAYVLLSAEQFRQGHSEEAIRLATIASDYAGEFGHYRGEGHYARARAFAAAADDDLTYLSKAADELALARTYSPGFIERIFYSDTAFDGKRAELAGRIGGIEF